MISKHYGIDKNGTCFLYLTLIQNQLSIYKESMPSTFPCNHILLFEKIKELNIYIYIYIS